MSDIIQQLLKDIYRFLPTHFEYLVINTDPFYSGVTAHIYANGDICTYKIIKK